MARQRSPDSLKAEELYLKSNGELELVEIGKQLNVSPGTVRSWKNRYKWSDKLQGNNSATLQNKIIPNKRNVAKNKKDKKINGVTGARKRKTNTNGKRGAPKGNKNAIGNKGGTGGPLGNKKAEKHGFFSKYLPDDTLDVIQEIEKKNPLDILWENIIIQYAAIIRAQKIMFIKNQEDTTKVLKKQKETTGVTTDSWEKEYELQFAWDKQATFLNAQSRAMSELRNLIKQYDEMLNANWDIATEEQKLRIEKLKADINKDDGKDKPIEILIKRKGED
ncbi:phage terminase small subunit [Clostridium oceanicum]|uniref:Phage terminase small subunit n=1 Tax=Clostridium oceanicum TaxID=1543 RepID=A0ABP3UJQ1_9CLOT